MNVISFFSMDEQWIGKGVDLNCGGLGVFQGVIAGVHLEEQTITIKHVIHNGVPSKMSSVTIEYEILIVDHTTKKIFLEKKNCP